jgi:hypothetical protein
MKLQPSPYLPAMFATCMLFMVIYSLCVALWIFFPDMPGHAALETIFPGFKLLDVPNFCYGMVMSAIYGWFVAVVFIFFYNLWPRLARSLFESKA